VEIPDWVRQRTNKWNRVLDFAANPCDAPLSVWFQTLRPAAGNAVVTLLSFGLDDVVRGYFRPKGIYPRGCLSRKRRPRSAVGIPELGEEIGKRLPAADAVKSRAFGVIEKNLWLLDGVSQRLLFYLLVVDVLTDFTYQWASGIYKLGFCSTSNRSQLQAQNTTYNSHDTNPTTWTLGFPGNVIYDRHAAFFPGDQPQLIAVGSGHATINIEVANPWDVDSFVTLGFKDQDPEHDQQTVLQIPAGQSRSHTFASIGSGSNWVATLGDSSSPSPGPATVKTFNVVGARPIGG